MSHDESLRRKLEAMEKSGALRRLHEEIGPGFLDPTEDSPWRPGTGPHDPAAVERFRAAARQLNAEHAEAIAAIRRVALHSFVEGFLAGLERYHDQEGDRSQQAWDNSETKRKLDAGQVEPWLVDLAARAGRARENSGENVADAQWDRINAEQRVRDEERR